MTERLMRVGAVVLVFAACALWLVPDGFSPVTAHAGGDKEGKAKQGGDDGVIVQHSVLRWLDGWPYGIVDTAPGMPVAHAASEHAVGELAAGDVTLTRSASGIHLEVRDDEALKKHAYSIWFQICRDDAVFIGNDTQCGTIDPSTGIETQLPKVLNINGSGGVAGPHGLSTSFDLAVGTVIGPSDFCDFDERWLTELCPSWGVPEVLSVATPGLVFTSDMALHGRVRIVVKDHGPEKNVKDVGKSLGMNTQEALFNATRRQDGPDCQPARSVCPDAHIALFAPPAPADTGAGGSGSGSGSAD